MSKFLAIEHTNGFGQTLRPGDRVVCVSQGYNHSIGVREAFYEGVNVNASGKPTSIRVKAKCREFGRWWPDGRKAMYHEKHPDISEYEYRDRLKSIALPKMRVYALR